MNDTFVLLNWPKEQVMQAVLFSREIDEKQEMYARIDDLSQNSCQHNLSKPIAASPRKQNKKTNSGTED